MNTKHDDGRETTRNGDATEVWSLIKDIRFAMVTHVHGADELRSQPMTTANTEFGDDHMLYFFLPLDSELAMHVGRESGMPMNLAYANTKDDSYVSINGTARLVNDADLKKKLFGTFTKAWFPKGVEDPNLGLLGVHANGAQYWKVSESQPMQVVKMLTAAVTGNPPRMGETGSVDL